MLNPWRESFEDLRSSIEKLHEEEQHQQAKTMKQARQLAYDIKYEVKKTSSGDNVDAAAIRRAYLSKLAKSPAAGPVKAKARQMLIGVKEEVEINEEEQNLQQKFKYRVKDKNKGTYILRTSRQRIEKIKKNPSVISAERINVAEEIQNEAEVKRWWDDDGDGKGYEPGEVEGKFKKKKKSVKKESLSNWREEMGENFFF